MERRLTQKIHEHQQCFKESIKEWLETKEADVSTSDNVNNLTSDFLRFVFDFQNLTLSKDDFRKRKRTKNQVPQYERCTARRANGEQCTRRKKISRCF